jgi:DHA2 family multidrug resistance protein-like MFS transporter
MSIPDGLPQPERNRAMAVILLGIVLAVLDGTIVNLALPGIAVDLHAQAAQSVWVVNAYQVATLALLLPCATLGDLIGYRKVYLVGVAIFTAASLMCVFSRDLHWLTAARALQGIGSAGIMGVNAAMVRLIYPRSMLGRGVSFNSMVVATAAVAGPTVAAAILSVASWPWLFVLNLPLGVVVLVLGWRSLPANSVPPAKGARISWLDVALNMAMFSLVFMGVDALGVRGDGDGTGGSSAAAWTHGLALVLAGVLIGFVYIRRQLRKSMPLFPVDLMRIPLFRLSMCTSVAAFAAQMLAYIALPFLLLGPLGRTHGEAGLVITAWPLAIVAVAPITGRLIGRYSDGLLGAIGLAMLAAGLALLATMPAMPSNLEIVWRMALCGAGFGLFQSPNNHTIVTSAPAHRSGGASGMLGTARLTGQTSGAVLLAVIFGVTGGSAHDSKGPLLALGIASAFAAVAAVISLQRVAHTPKSAAAQH